MNHNIFETIMSKTAFPVYSLEYWFPHICTGPPNPNYFHTEAIYGLYHTKEDIEEGISELRNIQEKENYEKNYEIELHVRIKMITSYGTISGTEVEEYIYYNCEKYRRIYRITDPKIGEISIEAGIYEYQKIE